MLRDEDEPPHPPTGPLCRANKLIPPTRHPSAWDDEGFQRIQCEELLRQETVSLPAAHIHAAGHKGYQ